MFGLGSNLGLTIGSRQKPYGVGVIFLSLNAPNTLMSIGDVAATLSPFGNFAPPAPTVTILTDPLIGDNYVVGDAVGAVA